MRTIGLALLLAFACTSCELFSGKEGGDACCDEAKATAAPSTASTAAVSAAAVGWVDLFDGKSFEGWKINENPGSWSVKDGAIVANGERSHLFFVGEKEPFVNFELEAVIMTKPNSNSGVYFHTQYQDSGWPKYGFEVQVNNSYPSDPQRTAGLYAVCPVNEAPAKDDEWFTMRVRVEGKHAVIQVNDKTLVDYTEPEGKKPGEDFTRVFDKGTFALQAHDPGSTVLYKSVRVRRLP